MTDLGPVIPLGPLVNGIRMKDAAPPANCRYCGKLAYLADMLGARHECCMRNPVLARQGKCPSCLASEGRERKTLERKRRWT